MTPTRRPRLVLSVVVILVQGVCMVEARMVIRRVVVKLGVDVAGAVVTWGCGDSSVNIPGIESKQV